MIQFEIRHLFPTFLLEDKNGYAMIKAIERMLNIMCETVQAGVDTVQNIDKMPEWRLDEMAWEMNAQWYDYEQTIEEKRTQIRGAVEYYDRIGTPYAVERAINDVYGEGWIEEWFQNGMEPYHFCVYTTNTSVLLENRAKFIHLLEVVKNARSVMENIYYQGNSAAANMHVATSVTSQESAASGIARLY